MLWYKGWLETRFRVLFMLLFAVFPILLVLAVQHHPAIPAKEHKEIHVDPKIFDGYVGVYHATPNALIKITREGDHLYGQVVGPGQGKLEIFPESEKEFFCKAVDAQITFVTDQQGRATALIFHQGGLDTRAQRVGGAAAVQEHKEVHVDPKIFDGYVGDYQLTPKFGISIRREGDHLYAQATGQQRLEIFPESEKDYFYKVVDARITFVTDQLGRATALVLHQNGADRLFQRVDRTVPALAALEGAFGFLAMYYSLVPLFLAGSGIKTESGGMKKGLPGSIYFTLAMPVSRLRLFTTRVGLGFLETLGILAIAPCAIWIIFAEPGDLALSDMLGYWVTLSVCASAFYFLGVLLSTLLDEVYRQLISVFGLVLLWWLLSAAPVPASVNIFQAMNSPLLTHSFPWASMGISLGAAAILCFAAMRVVQTREY